MANNNKNIRRNEEVVARSVWLETHFTFDCPACGKENEVVSLGTPLATVGRCLCGQVVHVRQAMPKIERGAAG